MWLIEPDPVEQAGQPDPAGKLRVLGLRADPPEAAPGDSVAVRSLVVTHPQQGRVVLEDGASVHTPQVRGLDALWLACREPEGRSAAEPCGLEQSGPAIALEQLPVSYDSDGPTTRLTLPRLGSETLPYNRLVTLVVADQALAGGAQACLAQAAQNQGRILDPNHCVIAVKRIRVSRSGSPNRNPEIARLRFGGSADSLVDLTSASASYPLLDPATRDEDRPSLLLSVERAVDAVEIGSGADGGSRSELLSASFFSTAGTLEAGRGTFLDLGCAGDPLDCMQLARSDVSWQPPAARAAREAPEQRVYFFVVLRDDRGGLSFMSAAIRGR